MRSQIAFDAILTVLRYVHVVVGGTIGAGYRVWDASSTGQCVPGIARGTIVAVAGYLHEILGRAMVTGHIGFQTFVFSGDSHIPLWAHSLVQGSRSSSA